MKKVPEDMNTVTPSLNLKNAAEALKLYEKALGAKTLHRMDYPGTNKIMHACIQIGDSKLFIADHNPEMGCGEPSASSFYVYMEDVDAGFTKAKQAGLSELFPVQDMFWGDRTGTVKDPNGITWTLATHVRDVSPEEIEEGKKKFAKAA